MAKDLAIVLNNGGVNALVATALAAQKHRTIMLYVDGAGVGARARAAYDQQVAHFKPYREHTIAMPWLDSLTPAQQSAPVVTDPRRPAPLGPQMIELIPLIAAAVRFAAHHQAAAIFTGLRIGGHGDELAQATEYGQVWNDLIQTPCGLPELMVEMPLLELDPWQVVDLGFQVNAPLDRSWSCFEDTPEPCWACQGCRMRESAFQQAAKADSLRAVKKL